MVKMALFLLRYFRDFTEELGEISLLFLKVIKGIFSGELNFKNIYMQSSKIGIDSLPVALTTIFFVGMVFAIQIANEFIKFGAGNMVGGVVAISIARELAPLLTGVVMAGRVGAAIAAELGTMKVTQQIDALLTLGSNPVKYLIIPRFIGATIMLPVITAFTMLVGFFGGFLVAVYVAGINSISYMDTAQSLLVLNDIFGGLFKAAVFGMLIAIISCYRGLNAKNGAKGVGEATTSAVVTSLISIFVANYFLSLLFFQ